MSVCMTAPGKEALRTFSLQSKLPQRYSFHAMRVTFAQDQIRALPGGEDVLFEIDEIDRAPEFQRLGNCLFVREFGITVEIGVLVAEGRVAEAKEPRHVPLLDQRRLRIVQTFASLLWMSYGILNHSWPLIIASSPASPRQV